MALEEIQAVTARMASLDQRLQQLSNGPALGASLGASLNASVGVSPTSASGTPLLDQDFIQVLDRTMASPETMSADGTATSTSSTANTALQFASQHLGDPYVFGSDGPDSWDCSSLVQAAYQAAGVSLPRTASEQAQAGTAVAVDRNAIRPGDLVFMHGGKPPHDLGHVGIAISADQFIVAPHTGDKVQVESIPWAKVQRIRRVTASTNPAVSSQARPATL